MKIHPITTYCEAHEMFYSAFAKKVGCSKVLVSQMISGVRPCTATTARKIRKATKGEISIEELILWTPSKKRQVA